MDAFCIWLSGDIADFISPQHGAQQNIIYVRE